MALPRLRRAAGLCLLVALLAGAAGCAGKKVYREGASTITGRPGEFAAVELVADPTTGYSWTLVGQADPRIVALIDSDYAPPASATSGMPGVQRWTFRFVSPGTATLTFGYGRTWSNTPAEKATMFTVVVR